MDRNYIPDDVDLEFDNFREFFDERRQRMFDALSKLLKPSDEQAWFYAMGSINQLFDETAFPVLSICLRATCRKSCEGSIRKTHGGIEKL